MNAISLQNRINIKSIYKSYSKIRYFGKYIIYNKLYAILYIHIV